ncbi:MAG: SDR family NAD(P)-dependent oxidoreductase [Gemmatimonadaceae bacterium]
MKDLKGATAIVTGASRGIGPYIARTLAARGANVALAARNASQLDETRRACESSGVRAIAIATDVTSMDDLRRLVDTVEHEFGPIDVLVNNAGIEITASVDGHSAGQVDDIVRTNLNAPIQLTKLVLPSMLARKRGAIVNVSSLAGKSATPYNAIYSATKHGLNGFTSSLAIELDGTGVTAGVVCPGFVADAGMWADTGKKAPRMMREVAPQRVADAVIKVIGGSSEVLVAPGPIRPLFALAALFPGLTKIATKRLGVLDAMKGRAIDLQAAARKESAAAK